MSRGDGPAFLRRDQDFPLLVVSQDYELFFHKSGSIEKCLFEPTELLLSFADEIGMKVTFFVDAGMLCRMAALASESPELAQPLADIRAHVRSIASRGHEIGLHVHPHWEDTRHVNGRWDFSQTRYQLRDFSDAEARDIVSRYAAELNALCDGQVATFRAGGYCVEPFAKLGPALRDSGILVDSSVVPGMQIQDAEKGVDFSGVADAAWWRFGASPIRPDPNGEFLEIPITPGVLPLWHYWGRAFDRLRGRQPASVMGDGAAKAIGRREILRRLAGFGRHSELSMDAPKVAMLNNNGHRYRPVSHIMGHPKLLGQASLEALRTWIIRTEMRRFQTVSGVARAIRAGEFSQNAPRG